VNSVRQAVGLLDKDQPIQSIRAMDELATDSVAVHRTSMVLLAIFAGVAVLLSALGIYGVISYSVTQRTQEIGLRMALGARRSDELRLVVGDAMLVALTGLGVGLVGAVLLTHFVVTLFYAVRPTDPATFATVSILLAVVALLASYIPARRASKVDTMVALRYE
jgi:putative ABC transport system permease protein